MDSTCHPRLFRIVFFHGLESGPRGRKYSALVARFGADAVLAPDFTAFASCSSRLGVAEDELMDVRERLVLVGSSLGGLVASVFAHKHGTPRVAGVVLAAPAIETLAAKLAAQRLGALRSLGVPVTCVLGREDEEHPLAGLRPVAEALGARVIEVDDDHSLSKSLGVITDAVASMVCQVQAVGDSESQVPSDATRDSQTACTSAV
jgi:pimeloyl-ACP methyl ester carboxylesterase